MGDTGGGGGRSKGFGATMGGLVGAKSLTAGQRIMVKGRGEDWLNSAARGSGQAISTYASGSRTNAIVTVSGSDARRVISGLGLTSKKVGSGTYMVDFARKANLQNLVANGRG